MFHNLLLLMAISAVSAQFGQQGAFGGPMGFQMPTAPAGYSANSQMYGYGSASGQMNHQNGQMSAQMGQSGQYGGFSGQTGRYPASSGQFGGFPSSSGQFSGTGQYQSQFPGQNGQFSGQGQYPGQSGQFAGQFSGQPAQFPTQGQFPGQSSQFQPNSQYPTNGGQFSVGPSATQSAQKPMGGQNNQMNGQGQQGGPLASIYGRMTTEQRRQLDQILQTAPLMTKKDFKTKLETFISQLPEELKRVATEEKAKAADFAKRTQADVGRLSQWSQELFAKLKAVLDDESLTFDAEHRQLEQILRSADKEIIIEFQKNHIPLPGMMPPPGPMPNEFAPRAAQQKQ